MQWSTPTSSKNIGNTYTGCNRSIKNYDIQLHYNNKLENYSDCNYRTSLANFFKYYSKFYY